MTIDLQTLAKEVLIGLAVVLLLVGAVVLWANRAGKE
jgi:hypothetical protein